MKQMSCILKILKSLKRNAYLSFQKSSEKNH